MCAAHFTDDYFLILEESNLQYKHYECCEHYKVGQFQCRKDSLVLLTHTCKYVSIFKEFTADYSNAKFEQCRVELVWRFYDRKCRHGVMFMRHGATRKKTVSVIIISNYVLTECKKCLVYRGFYCFSLVTSGT